MAGFGFDDDDFSLSGLTQEGHEFDITVISSSSDDDNYDGLLLFLLGFPAIAFFFVMLLSCD